MLLRLRALSQHHVQINAPDLDVVLLEPGVETTSRDPARDALLVIWAREEFSGL